MAADRRRLRWSLVALAVLLAAVFAGLGAWQADRAQRKAHWLSRFEQALNARPQPLQAALAEPGMLPQRVSGSVSFEPALPWLLLDNQRRDAQVGVRAYRIGRLADSEAAVLVDFGWLPMSPQRHWPALPPPPARIELDGLLAPPPSVGLRMAGNVPSAHTEAQLLLYVDPAELSERFGLLLASRVLRVDPGAAFGFQRDLAALPNTLPPERHRGYAVQWFGLSATVLIVTALLLYRSRQR